MCFLSQIVECCTECDVVGGLDAHAGVLLLPAVVPLLGGTIQHWEKARRPSGTMLLGRDHRVLRNQSNSDQLSSHSTMYPHFPHSSGVVNLVDSEPKTQINILSTKSPLNKLPTFCQLLGYYKMLLLGFSSQLRSCWQWGGFGENMGSWATTGLHVGMKWGLYGSEVGLGNIWGLPV